MNPDEMRRQRDMMDAAYGAPGLKEQQYFGQGGHPMGPPSQAMEAQNNPFGREEDAFDHSPKGADQLWFIDQVNNGKATVLQGEQQMQVPIDLLPKGAVEGRYFDPKSGAITGGPDDETEERRRGLMDDEDEEGYGG